MTYDEKNAELQSQFLEKFALFHKIEEQASDEEKKSEAYLKIRDEFEKINLQYQDFLTVFKETNAKGDDKFGVDGDRCEV